MNVEHIYEAISYLRQEVRNFKSGRDGKSWAWSCLVCGDSSKDTRKARFGVTIKSGSGVCNCFNCGYANNFVSYLRSYHPNIYERFSIESFKETAHTLFNHDDLFLQNINDSDLLTLFYGNLYSSVKEWVDVMKSKKIIMSKNNFQRLYNIHNSYHKGLQL